MNFSYTRACILPLDEVFDAIALEKRSVNLKGYSLKINSLRMRTFLIKGPVCTYCGLKATHFAVEKHNHNLAENYHLNLYGPNETLFTCDHVIARCLGGENTIHNTTTACHPCNSKKGAKENKQKENIAKSMLIAKHEELKDFEKRMSDAKQKFKQLRIKYPDYKKTNSLLEHKRLFDLAKDLLMAVRNFTPV